MRTIKKNKKRSKAEEKSGHPGLNREPLGPKPSALPLSHAPLYKLYYNKVMQKMLLLSCCVPCSCAAIESLCKQGRAFAVLFYNPNIMPLAEYQKRKEENKKYCAKLGVPFFDLDYDNQAWLAAVAGLENEPERGARCRKCFEYRLNRAAQFAKAGGYDSFASVLGVSRHKSMEDVSAAAAEISAACGLPYEDINWRKDGLEPRRAEIIKQENMYGQTYCGCKFTIPKIEPKGRTQES